MAKSNTVKMPPEDLSGCHPIDRTDAQILAYLNGVRTVVEPHEEFFEGKFLIRQMAATAEGYGYPDFRLSRQQCADVLEFVKGVEPRNWKNFDAKDRDVPNPVMGLFKILGHVVDELRRRG